MPAARRPSMTALALARQLGSRGRPGGKPPGRFDGAVCGTVPTEQAKSRHSLPDTAGTTNTMRPYARHTMYKEGLAVTVRWFELDRGDRWGPGTRRFAGSYLVAAPGPASGTWQVLDQEAFAALTPRRRTRWLRRSARSTHTSGQASAPAWQFEATRTKNRPRRPRPPQRQQAADGLPAAPLAAGPSPASAAAAR